MNGQQKPYSEAYAEEVIEPKPKRRWQSYIWDSLDKSPFERQFLFRLDLAVLTFASLGYLIKYLDQANINNAFVSGMKEDLNLYGTELNIMQTMWTLGYIIGQIPSNLILTRVRPSIWIPSLELTWTILTFSLAHCNTAKQIYAVRFLVGLAESGFYPGMQYVIGSWYTKEELAKRSCIFHTSSAVASVFSGYLMAAVYHLEGVGGFRGWQWLFIVDGIISLPIALAGYLLLPDHPENCRAIYLTPDQRAFGKKRMDLAGRKGRQPFTLAKVKKIFTSWHIYLLTLLYITFNNGNNGSQPAFSQWLKAEGFAVWQINVYPSTTFAVQILTTLAYAWLSDSLAAGRRWPFFVVGGIANIVCYTSLAIWDIPLQWKWTCFILAGAGYGLSGLVFAWAHEVCEEDNEERALVTATMNELAYVVQAWLPLMVWRQTDAPGYRKGYVTVVGLSVVMIGTALVGRVLHRREVVRKAEREETLPHESDDGSPETSVASVETSQVR